jgi:hypothetical protein
VGRHVQRVEHVLRPRLVDEVGAGLEGIAQVRGHRGARESAGDEVALVGQPGPRDQVGVLTEQPKQLRQRPGRLHPLVAELAPDRAADLVDPVDLGGGAGVVVHEAGGQGSAAGVGEQDGSRRRVDGDPAHRGRGNLAQRVPARRRGGVPPVVGILLVARAVAAARQLPGSTARDGAVCGHGERADALRAEVQADPHVGSRHRDLLVEPVKEETPRVGRPQVGMTTRQVVVARHDPITALLGAVR